LTVVIGDVGLAHSESDQPKLGQCCCLIEDFGFKDPGPPAVVGEKVLVPKLRLTVLSSKTSHSQPGKQVILRYTWNWFEYPYPEHPLGVWSDAYDVLSCKTDNDGSVIVPSRSVLPRGWYAGWRSFGRKPSFKYIELSVENFHYWIPKEQLSQIHKDKWNSKIFTASRPDKFVGDFRVEVSLPRE
jgi:hypothetical protein